MAKLNQIIAIEKGIKARVYSIVSELYKTVQKPGLFNGFAKNYMPKGEEDEQLPPERQRVQFTVSDILATIAKASGELLDVTARKDWTNSLAAANVVIDDKVLLPNVPITYLLFLEKQLTDLRTFMNNLPVLDDAETWTSDPNSGLFRSESSTTHRSKVQTKPLVLYPATDKHPAQTQVVQETVISGFWTQFKQSGALPKPQREAMIQRAETLLQAVKQAREEANMIDECEIVPSVGTIVFRHLFGG